MPFHSIYSEGMRPTKVFSILTMLVSIIAIHYQPDQALKALTEIFPEHFWMLVLSGSILSRAVELVLQKSRVIIQFLTSIISIWVFSLLFTASMLATPSETLGLLFVSAVVGEIWILARTVEESIYHVWKPDKYSTRIKNEDT
jgi:hypothetical protein